MMEKKFACWKEYDPFDKLFILGKLIYKIIKKAFEDIQKRG